jgi:excinuclease UvrABC helicase subunit UvrB
MEEEMRKAAQDLDFEKAAGLRDLIFEMKAED